MKIYLGADHRGFKLKEQLKKFLVEKGYEVEDVGAFEYEENDDYPDFAYGAALKIAADPSGRGILLCGSGIGMDVVANKVKNIRATVAYSVESARHARANDDVNVITLAGDVLDLIPAQKIAEIFLTTPFSGEERHSRRLQKLAEIENRHLK